MRSGERRPSIRALCLRIGTLNPLTISFCIAVVLATGCRQEPDVSLNEARKLYDQNKLHEALPLFESAVNRNPQDAGGFAWLAETYRRLGRKEEAVKTAEGALHLEPCNSFAHCVLACALDPKYGAWEKADAESTWTHLMKAVECDSVDGNAWLEIWSEAIERGDLDLMRMSLRRIVDTGFLTGGILAYARWMLDDLPAKSILVTNGDMDTYPVAALQEVENHRQDVALVNRSLLNILWYARFIRDYYGIELPFEDRQLENLTAKRDAAGNIVTVSDQIITGWVASKEKGTLANPLAFSVTVDRSLISALQHHLKLSGSFLLWRPVGGDTIPDPATLRASIQEVEPAAFTGPLISEQDRSPVRRVTTGQIVRNITFTALTLSEMLINSGRGGEAERTLTWAENFEKQTPLGPTFAERIRELRQQASGVSR